MYATATATRTRIDRRLLAGLFIGILVAASLAFLMDYDDRFSFASPPGDGNSPTASGRDPLLWPFSRDSIWNLPIGADAAYVYAGIKRSTAAGMTTDVDVLILTPGAPITPVYYNDDAWNGGTRCAAEGGVLFSAPIPSNFIIPGAYMGGPHGTTPNYATAILGTDGATLYQGQPIARCTPDGTVTMWWYQTNENLYGRGNSGAHGGSMLSSLGGTIRLGELVPGGVIRHSMKLNMNSDNFYSGLGSHRWPATARDSCAPGCYTGSVPATRMGSLLALTPDFDFNQLETEPARILARAFIDYGGYIADNAAWSVYGIDTEYSPSGDVIVEFQNAWGFSMEPSSKDVPWARDMDDIFLNLHAVDNWDANVYNTVASSGGSLGAGLGAPRAPWAPEFGEAPPPPPPPPPPPGLIGTSLTLTTSRNPSQINETVTVSGRLVDVSGIPVVGRNVVLEWSGDQTTWYPEAQIGQFPITSANGDFTGRLAFRGSGPHQEYIRARFAGDATYASSLSPFLTQGVGASPVSSPTDPGAPAEPPAPTWPASNLETAMILGLLGLILMAAVGLQYRRVRMDRRAAKKGRKTARSNPKQPLRVSFANPDDELDLPL
jgi:hypothetical protein